jgi:hypothetical protein
MMHLSSSETRQRAGDWHGIQAVKAYRRRDYEAYIRHAKIAEAIWAEADAASV